MTGRREFWIEFGGDPSDDKEVYKRYCSTTKFGPSGFSDEVVHVIEFSAYAKAIEDVEFYRREWESRCEAIDYANTTIAELRAELRGQ